MPLEIERKFLLEEKVQNEQFQKLPCHHIIQGYFLDGNGKTVRIRHISGSKIPDFGVITLKSKISDITRHEYEYEIPGEDATELLELCKKGVQKIRYFYHEGSDIWTIDIFKGHLTGLRLAEIELEHQEQKFNKPDFIGEEVTLSPIYKNSALAQPNFLKNYSHPSMEIIAK